MNDQRKANEICAFVDSLGLTEDQAQEAIGKLDEAEDVDQDITDALLAAGLVEDNIEGRLAPDRNLIGLYRKWKNGEETAPEFSFVFSDVENGGSQARGGMIYGDLPDGGSYYVESGWNGPEWHMKSKKRYRLDLSGGNPETGKDILKILKSGFPAI